MENIDFARLFYLVLFLTALLGWFIAEYRRNLGQGLRMMIAWGMIFLGVIAGYGLWDDIRDEVMPRQSVVEDGSRIEVPRGRGGHFHLVLDVNGTPIDFLVDTGASDIVLSQDDARLVGLDPDALPYLGTAYTANGNVRLAYTTLDSIELGPIAFDNVPASVNGGEMEGSLLGMSFLNRFERMEISRDRLILEP